MRTNQPLAEKYQDHDLSGEWSGYRECHIKPDLLLIYQKQEAMKNRKNTNAQDALLLARLGSHSELNI
jgi:mRNA interferase YafQ